MEFISLPRSPVKIWQDEKESLTLWWRLWFCLSVMLLAQDLVLRLGLAC